MQKTAYRSHSQEKESGMHPAYLRRFGLAIRCTQQIQQQLQLRQAV